MGAEEVLTGPDPCAGLRTPALGKAVKMLETEYARGRKLEYVRNPLAWALYKTWKWAEEMGGPGDV